MGQELWRFLFRRKIDPEQSLLETLSKIPLFQGSSKKDIRVVRQNLHLRHYRPGELIFREDEAGAGMYIIERGSVRIGGTDPSGAEIEYAILTPGEFFGELSLVSSSPEMLLHLLQKKPHC